MIPIVEINGYNFAQWASESGITATPIYRRQKSVVAIDGTEYRTQAMRWQITIKFVDLNEDILETLQSYLTSNPASVTENVTELGYTNDRVCYISGLTHSPKKVKGNRTDYTGFALTLEEM